jgi:FMN phosphatase YigB (HAD superfamily)
MEHIIRAVIGPRNCSFDLTGCILDWTQAIITSDAKGICYCAWQYALRQNSPLLLIRPEYASETGGEPKEELYQNSLKLIIDCAQGLIAFWDGKVAEVRKAIQYVRRLKKR